MVHRFMVISRGAYSMFFNLLSWPGERYREDFYANEHAQNVQSLLNRTAIVHSMTLDPI